MVEEFTLDTVDRYGQPCTFQVRYFCIVVSSRKPHTEHDFFIFFPELEGFDFFQFSATEYDDSLRISQMAHNDWEHLSAKGIPDAMIEYVSSRFKKPITSSSNKVEMQRQLAEFRTIDADKVWDRLVAAKKAEYILERHIYVYPVGSFC